MLVHRSGHLEWEPGSNRAITVPASAAELQVVGHWGKTEDTDVLELQQHPGYRKKLAADLAAQQAKQLAREEQEAAAVAAAAAPAALPAGGDWTQLDGPLLDVLQDFKADVLSGLSGVTATVQVG